MGGILIMTLVGIGYVLLLGEARVLLYALLYGAGPLILLVLVAFAMGEPPAPGPKGFDGGGGD